MRELEQLNPRFARPSRACPAYSFIMLISGGVSLAVSEVAATQLALAENPLSLLSCGVLVIGLAFIVFPILFKWGWETGYFGAAVFQAASVALFGLTPCVSFVLFGRSPVWPQLLFLAVYLASLVLWCRRFVVYYRVVFADDTLRAMLYQVEDDAIYYIQQGDKYLFEKHRKLEQCPSAWMFIASFVGAFAVIPIVYSFFDMTGFPVIHAVLAVLGLPISMMMLGFATRGWLIFYYYPHLLRRTFGRKVYVDMSARPVLPVKLTKRKRAVS